MALKQHILLIGNPGTGKSELLNALIGKKSFKSGISFGTGLTTHLQAIEHEGIVYVDSPGLDDLKRREEAASEIKKALQLDGEYRLFFVINLNAGRLAPADLQTIEAVVGALSRVKGEVPFGIIFNKLSKNEIKALQKEVYKMLLHIVDCCKYKASGVDFVPINNDLDPEQELLTLESEFKNFVYTFDSIVIKAENVDDVVSPNEARMKELTKQMEEVKAMAKEEIDRVLKQSEAKNKELQSEIEEQKRRLDDAEKRVKDAQDGNRFDFGAVKDILNFGLGVYDRLAKN